MAKPQFNFSLKHLAIDQATKTITTVLTISAVVLTFTLIGSRHLFTKLTYQNRVIGAKRDAKRQLQDNIKATDSLAKAYKTFEDTTPSVIGTGDKNSTVILDALPSKYDFPALTSSLEKILSLGGYSIESINGTDEEVAQSSAQSATVVEMPFTITISSNYGNIQKLIADFDRSIRPIHVLSIELSGADQSMRAIISAKTYYQTEQKLEISTKEIK